jgi:hypothetical protein
MVVLTAKVLAGLLQMHGPDATIQSDHPGIDALLGDTRGQIAEDGADLKETGALDATQVYFRRGFVRGGGYGGGGFRRAGGGGGGFVRGFRRY